MKYTLPIAFLIGCLFSIPAISFAEDKDDKDVNVVNKAKVARLKAKQRALARQNGTNGDPANSADGCGNINIGNVVNERGAKGAREINVVIDGDVISANNNCK
jgi:hypothetical protein